MQEEVTGKAVAIIIDGAKISEHTLEKALKAFLEAQKNKGAKIHRGKQSLKQLAGQNAGLANIEITDKNIKAFTAVAKKYHVDFALKKDTTAEKPRYMVFFKSRDADAITAAFQEFAAKKMAREQKLTNAEKREIKRIIEQAKGDGKARTAQDTLPFRQMYPDGLCRLDEKTWSRCIEFEDVNYQLAKPDDQTAIFEALCDMYNAHDASIGMELSLVSHRMNREDFVKRIEIAALGDGFDHIRECYTQIPSSAISRLLRQANVSTSAPTERTVIAFERIESVG